MRSRNDRNIAGEVGLRTDRVHLLSQRAARDHLKADRGAAVVGKCLYQIRFIERIKKADVDAIVFEASNFFCVWFADAADDIGLGE